VGAVTVQANSEIKEFYEIVRELEKRRCKDDLFYLSKFVLGKATLEKGADAMDWHHEKLCKDLMRLWRDRKDKNTKTTMKVEWPRGTLKSTICSVYFPVWVLLNDPETRILIESETATNANRFLSLIKSCFEAKHLQHLFGMLYDPRNRWNLEQLTLNRKQDYKEPSVDTGGVEVEKTGQHYDLYIGDDLQGKTNSQTRDQIEKVILHAKSVYSLLNPSGMALFPGTRWAHSDLGGYMDELNEEDDLLMRPRSIEVSRYTCWKLDKGGAMVWGDPEFPTLLPVEELHDMRAKQGPYVFSCNYLLNPTSDENAVFKSQWLRYHNKTDDELRKEGCEFYIAVDPAGEKGFDGSDYTAIIIAAISPRYDIYITDVIRDHMTRKTMADTLFALTDQFKPRSIGMEAVLKFRELYTWLKMEAKLKERWLPIREFTTSNKIKQSRIKELQPICEAGKFYIRREHKHLEDEMLRFPKGKHDDCLDAAAYVLEFLQVPVALQPKQFWEKDPNWLQNWTSPEPPPHPSDVRVWKFMNSMGQPKRRSIFSRPI
jgi:predicted phage terminase large subunit-like protein